MIELLKIVTSAVQSRQIHFWPRAKLIMRPRGFVISVPAQ